ncbi:MAG TPA: glycosyltransferase family 39 protein, partial [Thermoanaerobaculia bacterium]|nr:glycosyltransferase family 39 protein [Thermoanaerobaculia bacterium]
MRSIFARYRYLLAIAGLVAATAPLGVGNRPLCVGDETRETAIAKQMAESGDFLQARLGGMRMVEKPPFFYASVASSIRLRHGVTPRSARLPSILFSALTLLSAAAAASLLFSQRAGLLTAAILATTYLFVVNAHNVVVDVALTAFVSLGLLAFAASSRRAGAPRWDLGFGLAAAGAMLAKGFVGLALLSLLTLPFWLFSRPRRRLRESVTAGAVLAPIAALLFWAGVTYGRGGMAALSEAIWSQQVGRLLGFRRQEYSHHRAPFYFYLAALPGMLFPWVVTLPAAIRGGLRRKGRGGPDSSALAALAVGILAALLFLSVAGTKRTIYFLPVVPVAAILIGSFLDAKLAETVTRVPRILWAQFAVVVLAAVAVPLLPAAADGKIMPGEAARVAAVVLACSALGFAARRSPPRLVAICLIVAMGSLFLLDRYSLPRWERDRATRDFFARVERRVASRDTLYSYGLNQDVLGQACLQLSRPPLAREDPASLEEVMTNPGAYLLMETAALRRAPASWSNILEPVEVGRAGNRRVSLLRFRVRDRSLPREARRQEKLVESLSGSGRPTPPSAHETNSLAHAVRKKKSA